MVACGVNLFGFDQLHPADPRLAALVWSWAEGEPAKGKHAYQDHDGRFHSTTPNERRPHACRDAGGAWRVTSAAGRWTDGAGACEREFPGSTFAVPRTGPQDRALADAGGSGAWVDYARVGNRWVPAASRG